MTADEMKSSDDKRSEGEMLGNLLRGSYLPDELAGSIGQVVHGITQLEWRVSCFAYAVEGQIPGTAPMTRPGEAMREARKRVPSVTQDPALRARLDRWLDSVQALREARHDLVHANWQQQADGTWVGRSYKDGHEILSDEVGLAAVRSRIEDVLMWS